MATGLPNAHPDAGRFVNVAMHIERGEQGMNLRPDENVEVLGPYFKPTGEKLYFRSKEPSAGPLGAYFCPADEHYHLTVIIAADNANSKRERFIVFVNDFRLHLERLAP